jgi:hypothetical protein
MGEFGLGGWSTLELPWENDNSFPKSSLFLSPERWVPDEVSMREIVRHELWVRKTLG